MSLTLGENSWLLVSRKLKVSVKLRSVVSVFTTSTLYTVVSQLHTKESITCSQKKMIQDVWAQENILFHKGKHLVWKWILKNNLWVLLWDILRYRRYILRFYFLLVSKSTAFNVGSWLVTKPTLLDAYIKKTISWNIWKEGKEKNDSLRPQLYSFTV